MCRHGSRTQPGEGIPTLYTCREREGILKGGREGKGRRRREEGRGEGKGRRKREEGREDEEMRGKEQQTFSVVSPNILG